MPLSYTFSKCNTRKRPFSELAGSWTWREPHGCSRNSRTSPVCRHLADWAPGHLQPAFRDWMPSGCIARAHI